MRKLLIPVLLFSLLLITLSTFAQKKHRAKSWAASISLDGGRVKGELYSVSDSSVTILGSDKKPDEILFNDISKIKLHRIGSKGLQRTAGIVIGSVLGAWGTASILTKDRTGEPAALAGVVGGIGGGLIGAILGFFVSPPIHDLFSSKKFLVHKDPSVYMSLKDKLKAYTQ